MRGSTQEVARAFAKDQEEPRQANSLYFEGRAIYSYGTHWPLAVKLGDSTVLLNNDRTSVTTSRHRTTVAGALAQQRWVIIDGTLEECKAAVNDSSYRRQLATGPVNP